MTRILFFGIGSVPDVGGTRRVDDGRSRVGDADVLAWYGNFRRAATGGEFPPLYLHRVVAIGCVLRENAALTVWSLGELGDPEPELIRRFFAGIERYTPQLVSWNGGALDLPVPQYGT